MTDELQHTVASVRSITPQSGRLDEELRVEVGTPTMASHGEALVPVDDGNEGLKRGDLVGRYVVLEKLGAGGMGVVYLAFDPELDRRIALKLIRTPTQDVKATGGERATNLRSRLVREAQALAKLSHPNVVTVYDVGVVDDDVFIAMEYVEGQAFRAWMREKSRSWREVVPLAVAAGRGLAAAHVAGLVHRDFKPDNVIIDNAGRAYVLDFGLAQAESDGARDDRPREHELAPIGEAVVAANQEQPARSGHSFGSKSRDSLTDADTVLGTPAYMAPEQHFGQTDARSDQFAFCVALYEALYAEKAVSPK